MSEFTYNYYKEIFKTAIDSDYDVITVKDFFLGNFDNNKKILINRIDVDIRIDRLKIIYRLFKELNIKSSVYLRLHAPTYNLLSIGNINIIQNLISIGCEIGLHTELEDLSGYCNINKKDLLRKEIELFQTIFQTKIYGTASHGDITHYNNLDFWKENNPNDFGILYEAYDDRLWSNCIYTSDSEWVNWKTYKNGKLLANDNRDPIEHIKDNSKVIYLLTHPESWYYEYIHE
jgi:hypothetical protein